MARTAPVPNIPAIPGMNPGVFVMGGGGGSAGGGGNGGKGNGKDQGADGSNGGNGANGGGKSACGGTGGDGSGCPNHHGSKKSGKVSKGDPVDVATGRVFTDPVVDLELLGPLGLQFVRRYSTSAQERDVGLGFGWTHSFAWAVEVRRRTTVLWTDTGAELSFDAMAEGDAGLGADGWVLTRDANGFVLDDGAGTFYLFSERADSTYRLSAVRDAHGNTTWVGYREGRIESLIDAAGRVVRVRRTTDGRIAALEIKNAPEQGRWVTLRSYEYNEIGDLVAVADAEGCTTRYTYEHHRLTSRTDPEGLTFQFRYDAQGRCIETWGVHADAGRLGLAEGVPDTLADGTKARGIYHCKLVYGDDGYSEVVDSGTVHRYVANEFGKLDKAVSGGAVYSRTYDENGNLISFTDPLGATTTWVRDGRGRTLRVSDPLGRCTFIEREPDGHIRRVIDPAGGVTEVMRTANVLYWTDPIGATFEVRIDARGLIIETVAPNGARTRFEHDAHGNVVRKINAIGAVTEYTYDYWGRCLSVRDALGHVESYAYNNRSERVAVRHADGGVTRYTHNRTGDVVRVDHPDGTATRFEIGGLHKVCAIHRPNGEVNRLGYDREGRLVRAENARGDVYLMRYDAAGRMVYERTFTGLEKHYQYDMAGQLLIERTSARETTDFVYDAAGQLVQRILPDGTTESFEYDPCGNLIAALTPTGELTYKRNAVGWVLEERQLASGEGFVVRRTYDLMGNVTQRTTSLGHTVLFERDACGRATQVVLDGRVPVGVAHDALGREIARVLPDGGRIQVVYDALGRMVQRWVGNPAVAASAGAGRPGWVGARPPGTTVYQAYRYGPCSELVEAQDDVFGRNLFDHDPAGQIVGVRGDRGQKERYAYDAAGNLHEPTGEQRSYGSGNFLMEKGDTTYVWDESGRLVAARDAQGRSIRYRWNGLGLLAAVEKPDGTLVELSYDPFARRIGKRTIERAPDGQQREVSSVRFVWDGGVLVHEIKRLAQGSGDPVVEERTYCFEEVRYAPWAHRDARVAGGQREESPWFHYLNDDVGAPERLVGPAGEVVCELDRSAFSAKVKEGGRTTTPLRFPGQYEDEETGLVYNRYRYFDPALGRYLSADPAGLDGGFNGFDYAGNAPTRFVDPSGLMPFSTVRNAAGNNPEGKDFTDPRNRRGVPADIEGKSQGERSQSEEGQREKYYKDPAITEAVKNAQRARDPHKTPTGDTTCAEVDALHKMANQIRTEGDAKRKQQGKPKMTDQEVRSELQKRFKNGATIETTNKAGEGMAPCPMCAQIFRELGLHPANIGEDAKGGVVGPNDKQETKVNKMGRWDGTWTQSSEPKQSRQKNVTTVPSSTPPFAGT
ncbi:RHS repeat-associated core domain-containing protein [Sorangium sp. So ce131]|uniref:RHS repeat-associated core domain-containing protein n=1 Tax=Sorangium sp. So ce131 TaxID=3133282 RepID=UPI003F6221BD